MKKYEYYIYLANMFFPKGEGEESKNILTVQNTRF
jgi:hypothetical protein